MNRRHWILSATLLAGCGAQRPAARGPAKKQYTLKGEVLRLRPDEKIAVIKHEKIGDWMEAMTMDFPVPDGAEFAKLAEGQRIQATVNVNDDYFWLTDVHVRSQASLP